MQVGFINDIYFSNQQLLTTQTAPASMIAFNKKAFILASAHYSELRIWDIRKSDTPIVTITAHVQSITGMDWSPFFENSLLTTSHDKQVKVN